MQDLSRHYHGGIADSPIGLAAWLLDHNDADGQPAAAVASTLNRDGGGCGVDDRTTGMIDGRVVDKPVDHASRGRLRALYEWLKPATPSLHLPSLPASAPDRGNLPARIGQYAIERKLGQGGLGVVYAARDERLKRTIALKMMSSFANDERRARASGEKPGSPRASIIQTSAKSMKSARTMGILSRSACQMPSRRHYRESAH